MTAAELGHRAPVGSLGAVVTQVAGRLASVSEARWIVSHVTGLAPGSLAVTRRETVTDEHADAIRNLAERRAAGEPLQYVLGKWAFRRLEVTVDRRALIPRPETERVVEVALTELSRGDSASRTGTTSRSSVVADLGTGSAVIALSLALEAPAVEVWATDLSSSALVLAQVNLTDLSGCAPDAAGRVRLAEGSWFSALPVALEGHLDVVVSNPPYVSESEWPGLDPEIRDHEPRAALVAGPRGLEALELLVDRSLRWIAPGGSVVLELAPHQADAIADRARRAGYVDVSVEPDLAGRPRVLRARRPHGGPAG